MKKSIHIYPHIVLLIEGRLLLLLGAGLLPFSWVYFSDDINIKTADGISNLLSVIIITVFYGTLCVFAFDFLWPHAWGEIIVREKEVIYLGLFLPTVRLKFEDIKYVDIRTSLEPKTALIQNPSIDAYKFILISSNPLPQTRIDKIRTSRKSKLIKYAVSKKLCDALVDKLPQRNQWVIEQQLLDYRNYNKKAKKQRKR